MQHDDELRIISDWMAHTLTGKRKGVWGLYVTKNWRITFRINRQDIEFVDLDFEDYLREKTMTGDLGIRLKNPPHVGGFIRHEIIEAILLSVTGAAEARSVTR